MGKILLIEDDRALSAFLSESLARRLYEVEHVADGIEGLFRLENHCYAAAIVDWELPGMNGAALCKAYRSEGGSTPLLMLTGRDRLSDKIFGLDSGADDYLAKPFELEELFARLRALIRRSEKNEFLSESLKMGDINLNVATGEVFVGEKRVQVTRRELGILELLMRNPNHPISPEAIMERVWPVISETSPEVVRCHINKLRSKLRRASEPAADSIKSVYGFGYKMEMPDSGGLSHASAIESN